MTSSARTIDAACLTLLLERIAFTVDDEIDCDRAGVLVARFVDDQIAERDAAEPARLLEPHLRQCPRCADVMATVQQLAGAEDAGQLPSVDRLLSEVRGACRVASTTGRPLPTAANRSVRARLEAWRSSGRVLRVRPLIAVPALLVALLFVTSTGWWRAEGRADRNGRLAETVAGATAIRFNRMGDGAWARVAYDPADRHALVWAGGLPRPTDGQRYECWFAQREGDRIIAQALEELHNDPGWWYLETDRLVDAYDSFLMTLEPQGDVVVEVALHDPAAEP